MHPAQLVGFLIVTMRRSDFERSGEDLRIKYIYSDVDSPFLVEVNLINFSFISQEKSNNK